MRPVGTAVELERRRRRAVHLLEAGHGLTTVARMVGAAKSAVWQWRETVRRKGPAGLAPKPTPGRPSKLTARQRAQLPRVLARGARVEMFTFEGAAYDLAAAAVGAILGAIVAFGMVIVMAKAFGAGDADEGLQIEYAVSSRSLLIAFAIGVLLTLVVVAFSAWRVSVMTISSAIRGLPEPTSPSRRRRLVLALVGLAIGLLLVWSGLSSDTATPLLLGVSLALMSLVPLLRLAGVPERLAFTACGLAVVVYLLLPWRWLEPVFGDLAMDFTTWIVSGLLIVVGTVWVIVFNADLLLGA